MGLLDGKVVLVTGSSRNLGAGTARCLAREGATVAVNYLKNKDKADEVAESIRSLGQTASVWQCDVTDSSAVEKMIEGIVSEHGRIDAVINNATAGGTKGWSPDNWPSFVDAYEANMLGPINTMHFALPYMQKQGGGRFVNIISQAYLEANPNVAHSYMAAKAALVTFTRVLVAELGPHNITINCVSPGWTRTDRMPPDIDDADWVKHTPLMRVPEAYDVGDVCVFLLSDLARHITGCFIPADGGRIPQLGA